MAKIHTKTAFDYIRRSPFQALAAVFVLAITFFVSTLLAILVYSSNNVIRYFETRPQVIAFLKNEITTEQIANLQNKLIADERVKDVQYVSKEEALSIYKSATSDNPLLSELVSPSIFPASLEFSLKDLTQAQEIIDEVKTATIVDQVGFTASLGGESDLEDVVERLKNITYYLRVGGGIFAGLLVATSFLVLIIIIGMRMSIKKGEIEILDLIGATPGFIRNPILIEALIYSLTGVVIGWLLNFVLFLYLTPSIVRYFAEVPVLPRDTLELMGLFGIILGIEVVIGSLLALTGSMLAISRARRSK